MQTPLAATYSKWITNGKPGYPGDFFNNWGCYWPTPDYEREDWRRAHILAEKFTIRRSNNRFAYDKQAMFYYPASSGRDILQEIMLCPERVIEHARRYTDDNDVPYLTMRGAASVLDPERMQNIFSINYQRNMIAAGIAARHMPDTYIVAPPHRERVLRNLKEKHSILRGITFEDAVFELHLWYPFCLFDATKGIYNGPGDFSFNGEIEKALAAAIQYGSKLPLSARYGQSFDITDILDRPVSIADQAWANAQAILDIIIRKVRLHDGSEVGFRCETAVALFLSRFMHDDFYRNDSKHLDRARAHPTVKYHYYNQQEQDQLAVLKDLMFPVLAELCNWPTLHRILDQDKDACLKQFWEEQVMPSRGRFRGLQEVYDKVMAYGPRGGCDDLDLQAKIVTRRDKPQLLRHAQYGQTPMAHGQHVDPFDKKHDPLFFNDRNFARLGGTSSPKDDPNPDHYTSGQVAAIMTLAECLHDGLPPANAPRTLLYLDDAAGGVRAADFMQKNKIDRPGEHTAIFDPLAEGGKSFAEDVVPENRNDLLARVGALIKDPANVAWRDAYKIGNIVTLSDVRASLNLYEKGYREGTKTFFYEAIAADGPRKFGRDVEETVVRRAIDLELSGVSLLPGELSNVACTYITEGVLVATGLVKRPYPGGDYQFEFFMDHDYCLPLTERQPPQKLDLADLIIHVGLKVKDDLDARNPPKNRDRYVTMARLLQIYEMLVDPVCCNRVGERLKCSGRDINADIIDWKHVDPSFISFNLFQSASPVFALSKIENGSVQKEKDGKIDYKKIAEDADYQAFVNDADYRAFVEDRLDLGAYAADPSRKAKLAQMIWFYMRADRVLPDGQAPVIGHLLIKGAHAFDRDDTNDMPFAYEKARDWWHNLSARQKNHVFGQNTKFAHGPKLSVA